MSLVAETATLAHGYTMAEIDSISFKAARRCRSSVMDFRDKQETAWGAIVEMLYSSVERPTRFTLLDCGSDAADRESRQILRSHGVRAGETGVGEHDERPKYLQYWLPIIGPMSDFTDRIVEREALPQILAKLTAKEYEVIATLAAYGSQKEAAEALGLTRGAFGQRLWKARERLWRYWYDFEVPPPKSRTSATTCRYGHSKEKYGFVNNHGTVACRLCARRATSKHYYTKARDTAIKLDLGAE